MLEPATVGVPATTPGPAASDNPAGNAPESTVHVYGPTPPVTVNVVEYGTDTSPPGGGGNDRPGAATTVIDDARVATWFSESTTSSP